MNLFVIYRVTSSSHARQYAQLAREHSSVAFIEQDDFRQQVMELLVAECIPRPVGVFRRKLIKVGPVLARFGDLWISSHHLQYVLFLVDDNIFVRDFSLRKIRETLQDPPKALGFSLRLGTNTGYCYPLDKPQTVPTFARVDDGVLMFDWSNVGDSGYDFAYPLEVSSSVYRIGELLPFLNRLPFHNPNSLEGQMASNSHRFRVTHPLLLCYERSVTFCTPLNRVQTTSENRAATNPEYSAERLARTFEEGYRINVGAYSGFVPNACHQEVELVFEKRAASSEGAV